MGEDGLYAALVRRGMSRRAFLQFSAAMAAALALPASYAPRIAEAVSSAPRLPLIWIRAQGCGGNTEAILRATDPTVATLLLETISMEYQEAFMAPTGGSAELVLTDAMARFPDGYFAVIEGAIPTGASRRLLPGRRPSGRRRGPRGLRRGPGHPGRWLVRLRWGSLGREWRPDRRGWRSVRWSGTAGSSRCPVAR